MMAAGTSVISSQKRRNDSASRAQSTPMSESRNAELRTPVRRPGVVLGAYEEANTSAGEATSASVTRKAPVSPSIPACGVSSLVNGAPQVSPETRAQSPAAPSRSAPADCTTRPVASCPTRRQANPPIAIASSPTRTSAVTSP
jgi:hypothetical protein